MRNVAVVLAGGTGTRAGLSVPEQLTKVAARPTSYPATGVGHLAPVRPPGPGQEPACSLPTSDAVAATALEVLVSGRTGHVADVRRGDALAAHLDAAPTAAIHAQEPGDVLPDGVDPGAGPRG